MEKKYVVLVEEESGAVFELTRVHEGWYPRATPEDRAYQAWDSLFTKQEAEAVIAEVKGWARFKNPSVEAIALDDLVKGERILNIQKQLGPAAGYSKVGDIWIAISQISGEPVDLDP